MEDIMLHIISRQDALTLGLRRYFSGKPCSHGHVVERQVGNKNCVACRRARDNRRTADPELKAIRQAYDRARWENDREYLVAKNRRYYAEKADEINAQKRGYWAKNRQRMREANHHVVIQLNAERKAHIRRATPSWADKVAIRAVYAESARLTRETGIPHHVDHIIPLKGELVCGLHVHWNLRAIPWRDNITKKNKLLEEIAALS
ncbi:MAG TPA: hypothetical protein VF534_01605 [Paraburkholderia sp.]